MARDGMIVESVRACEADDVVLVMIGIMPPYCRWRKLISSERGERVSISG